MLCFEVRLNGKRLCTAGVGDAGVISAIVSWVGGAPTSPKKRGRTKAGVTDLHVGGLFHPTPDLNVHPRWVQKRLRTGDTVTIRIVRGATPDTPRSKTVATADTVREQQRRYFLRMKAEFEKPRA